MTKALGSAKRLLLNRHNAVSEQWEAFAKAALDDIDKVL
jgi:hypothetical protein